MNHQANGSPVDHFDTPLDLFKGLDELGGKKMRTCVFLHTQSLTRPSPSTIVFGIPSTQNPATTRSIPNHPVHLGREKLGSGVVMNNKIL
jgi:hypothetical protein